MTNTESDAAVVSAALRLAAESGWRRVTVANAARAAGVPLQEARVRFPSRNVILLRFGAMADQAALTDAPAEGPLRDRLFDLLMRRFDAFQMHREGLISVLRALPYDPPLALMLGLATERSMRWMLEAAGADLSGPRGCLTIKGCVGVWLWTLRAWERDPSEDISGTMAALDTALQRAEQMADRMRGAPRAKPAEAPGEDDTAPPMPAMPEDIPPDGPSPQIM